MENRIKESDFNVNTCCIICGDSLFSEGEQIKENAMNNNGEEEIKVKINSSYSLLIICLLSAVTAFIISFISIYNEGEEGFFGLICGGILLILVFLIRPSLKNK